MKKAFLSLMAVFCMAMFLASCKPSIPSDVLSKGKMTDILFDYHLALAMARMDGGGDQAKVIAYREAVLKKHDVTSAEFDSSMVYYTRHTELLEEVYKDLADRMSNEVIAQGGNGNMGQFDNLSETGDTANIWKLSTAMVFSPQKPFNETSFKMDADTAFHKGDRLMLDFDTQFIFQDGMRDGIALLAIVFKNDSVAQQVIHLSGSQHYSLELADNDSLGIKSVKGYFMLGDGGFGTDMSSLSTLKLMFVENIKLIRMHPQKLEAPKPSDAPGAPGDSAKKDSGRTALPVGSVNVPSSSASSSPASPSSSPSPAHGGPRLAPPSKAIPVDRPIKFEKMK